MKNFAKVVSGVVTNISVGDDAWEAPAGTYECPESTAIGWLHNGTTFSEPVAVLTPEQQRNILKAARAAAVAAITVTTSTGKVFDGDETSQTRMARAIIGLQAAGVPTITWTLADNTIVDVTVAELTEAMILSGQQQAALWPIPE